MGARGSSEDVKVQSVFADLLGYNEQETEEVF